MILQPFMESRAGLGIAPKPPPLTVEPGPGPTRYLPPSVFACADEVIE